MQVGLRPRLRARSSLLDLVRTRGESETHGPRDSPSPPSSPAVASPSSSPSSSSVSVSSPGHYVGASARSHAGTPPPNAGAGATSSAPPTPPRLPPFAAALDVSPPNSPPSSPPRRPSTTSPTQSLSRASSPLSASSASSDSADPVPDPPQLSRPFKMAKVMQNPLAPGDAAVAVCGSLSSSSPHCCSNDEADHASDIRKMPMPTARPFTMVSQIENEAHDAIC